MYILQQIKTQFIQNILAFEIGGGPDDGFRGGEEADTPQIPLQEGEVYEAAARLEEQLDGVKNERTFHSQYCTKVGDFLEGVKNGEYPDLDPNDKEFAEMLSKYDKRIESLEALAKEGHQIESELDFYLAQLSEKIDDKIISSSDSGLSEAMREQDEQMEADLEKQEGIQRLENQRDSFRGILRETLKSVDTESDEFKNQSEEYKNIIIGAQKIAARDYVYQNLDDEGNPIAPTKESIIREIEHLENTNRELNVLLNNNTPEGETTLAEAKDAKIQEKFDDLKENGTKIQKEIIGEKGFLDLSVADFQRLQLDGGVDLSEWFLRPSPNNSENPSEGSTFTVHFGGNLAVSDIISSIIPLHVDSVVLDGKVASRVDGTQFKYDRGGRFTVLDGSEIVFQDVNREVRDSPELLQERLDDFREQMASNFNRDTFQRQANNYIQSIDTVGPENEDGWFMTMFKKVMNGLAALQGMDPIFEEVLEKEEPYYNSYSQADNDRMREQGVRRFVPNGNELLRDGEFMTELSGMCDRLGVQRDDMLIVMQAESKLDPTAVNDRSGASGLIQFMPNTAEGLGTSVQAIRNMSAVQQLEYVEKYFKNYAGRMNSVSDIYRVVFYPASIGKPSDWVLGSQNGTAQRVADQNGPGITQYSGRPDGLIDNATFDRYVEAKISQFSTIVTSPSLAEYENHDVTKPIKDLEALDSGFRVKVENWLSQVRAAGINIQVTETLRTQARQNYLYEQGRTRPGDIVTWTRSSNHKTGQAIDIFFDPNTHGSMYPPINSEPWTTTARLARENGIDWGQDLWGKDGAHFQNRGLS